MSISPARLAANRRNARKSTGPRTAKGKQAVARNALSHGAYATDQTIQSLPTPAPSGEAGPSMPAYPELLAAFAAEYAPHGPTEESLVQRLATCAVRLDLLARALDDLPNLYQRGALAEHIHERTDLPGPATALEGQPDTGSPMPATLHPDPGIEAIPHRNPGPDPGHDAAACLVLALTSPQGAALFRYENAADRRFLATLAELRRLQADRHVLNRLSAMQAYTPSRHPADPGRAAESPYPTAPPTRLQDTTPPRSATPPAASAPTSAKACSQPTPRSDLRQVPPSTSAPVHAGDRPALSPAPSRPAPLHNTQDLREQSHRPLAYIPMASGNGSRHVPDVREQTHAPALPANLLAHAAAYIAARSTGENAATNPPPTPAHHRHAPPGNAT